MTSLASQEMRDYAKADDALPDYPSSINSGIVGDAAHRTSNSYHNSLEDNPNRSAGSYTNNYADDRVPPGTWSRRHVSATDKTMSTADMIKEWNRYLAVFNNRRNDPRARYIAEYIGWNGVGEAERLDFRAGTRRVASKDHKWHSHKGRHRRYHADREANRAFLSVDRGETVAQYLGQKPPTSRSRNMGMFLAQVTGRAEVWKGNGLESEGVSSQQVVLDLLAMGAEGSRLSGVYPGGGKPFGTMAEMEAVIGRIRPADPTTDEIRDVVADAIRDTVAALEVELTDEQIAKLGSAIGQSTRNPLTPEQVTEAVKQALRDGAAG